MQFTMESFLSVFEHFMGKYKVLLENGGAEEGSPSHLELCELVASRVSSVDSNSEQSLKK